MQYGDKRVVVKKMPRDMKGWERKEWERRHIFHDNDARREWNGMISPIFHDGNGYKNPYEC